MKTNLRASLVLLIMFGCVGCDQASKFVARDQLPLHATISFFSDTLRLRRTENPGAFLSLGESLSSTTRLVLFTLGGALLVGGTALWAFRSKRANSIQLVAAGLICGGGLSNVLDRAIHGGEVTDFLNVGVGPSRTGIFNLADMALMFGIALLIVGDRFTTWLRIERRESSRKRSR
jgi:signal peptidase II